MLNAMQQMNVLMTGTTAKAQLVEMLLEPLKGCKGLYRYRQDLIKKVMAMPDGPEKAAALDALVGGLRVCSARAPSNRRRRYWDRNRRFDSVAAAPHRNARTNAMGFQVRPFPPRVVLQRVC